MGYIFYRAINKATDAGKLVEPGEMNSGPTICDKFERNGMEVGGFTQRGSCNPDGIYYHNSEEKDLSKLFGYLALADG